MSLDELCKGVRWYLVSTKPQQEERAENNLAAWRVETFAPRVKRRRGRAGGEPVYSIKPLLPDYTFARFEDGFVMIGDELKPGDRVMIKAPAFDNFAGVFERGPADSERVRVLLDAVSYQSRITIDRALVEKLEPNYLSV